MPTDPETPDVSPPPLVTEATAADAAVAQAREAPAHGHGPRHTHCENCGAALHGPFCHQCGQHDFEFHRSFGHVFLEALENFFHFDAKLFRNVVTLLFQPGRLTAEFNTGKRASQMPPFRLYLFVSVLFFFVRFLGVDAESADSPVHFNPPASAAKTEEAPETISDALRQAGSEIQQAAAEESGDKAGPKPAPKRSRENAAAARELNEKLRHAFAHKDELVHTFIHALPKLLLVCLPLFALYTRVFFRQHGYVYLQHLVLALHYHTFVYLWWLVMRGWSGLAGLISPALVGLATAITVAWMVAYPVLMFRHLFGQSWPRALIKTLLLGFLYGTSLGLGLAVTATVIFLTL